MAENGHEVQSASPPSDLSAAAVVWKKQFAGIEATIYPTVPPSHRPRPDAVAQIRIPLSDSGNAGEEHRWAPMVILRAAWTIVLARRTNATDVVFGALAESQDGTRCDAYPVRIAFRRDMAVQHFLQAISDQAELLVGHQHTGLKNIAAFGADCDVATNFHTMIAVDSRAGPSEWEEDYPLSLRITTRPNDALNIILKHDPSILSPAAANGLLKQLQHTISVVTNSDHGATVESFFAIDQAERATILKNNGELPPVLNTCIHDAISTRAYDSPDCQAVEAWDGNLTYRELDERSSLLARHLVSLGAGPGVNIPLCFERSLLFPIAILAVLKAGACFVPLDGSHPTSRLHSLCRRTGATMALVSTLYSQHLPEVIPNCIVVDHTLLSVLDQAEQLPAVGRVSPNDVAYILFTSGSTGEPKGPLIEHASFLTSATEYGRAMQLHSDTRALHFSSHSFGACLVETLVVLVFGGCIVIPSEHERINAPERFMSEHRINWAVFASSFVSGTLRPEHLPTLQTLVVGGEPLTADVRDTWADRVKLVYVYGQSETNSVCSTTLVRPESDVAEIGQARGARLWLVDPLDANKLVPRGCIGEILVETAGAARGYLTKDSLRAFVPAPGWAKEISGPSLLAFFKTGDLGIHTDGNSIACLGRQDFQVKIRGQKVVPGEVEHYISQLFPLDVKVVAEALQLEHSGRDSCLVAFLSSKRPEATPPQDDQQKKLQDAGEDEYVVGHVRPKLELLVPRYMIPSFWLRLPQSLPSTGTGKIDRKKLRQMGQDFIAEYRSRKHDDADQEFKPKTPKQHTLTTLWAQILKAPLGSISIKHDFFRLGGDSIKAMKLVSELSLLNMRLTVQTVFRRPILQDMADAMVPVEESSHPVEVPDFSLFPGVPIRKLAAEACKIPEADVDDVYPCTSLQAGMIALSSSQHAGGYVTRYVLELSDDVDLNQWREAWIDTIQSMAILRTRIVALDTGDVPELVQVVTDSRVVGVPTVETLDLAEYLAQDSDAIVLGQPLARFSIVSTSSDHYFVCMIHHALFDAWSLKLILRVVTERYHGSKTTQPVPFKHFIKYLSSTPNGEWQAFWQDYLQGVDNSFYPPPASSFAPVESRGELSEIQRFCAVSCETERKLTTTRTELLKAALAMVLGSLSGTKDVVFGCVVSGRAVPVQGIEWVAGPTISTCPFRVRLHDGDHRSIHEFLSDVQDNTTNMMSFEQAGLQRIAALNSDAELACGFRCLLSVLPEEESVLGMERFGRWHREYMTDPLNYPLLIQCELREDGISIVAKFDKALSHEEASNLLDCLSLIIEQLARATPDTTFRDISIASDEDIAQIWRWNSDLVPESQRCVHDLILEQARLNAELPAICAWDGELLYKQLDSLSGRLAQRLRAVGLHVGPECVIPLFFEKSVWTPVAMLGVMRAGAASLLIDCTQPVSRLQAIIKQVQPRLFLCSRSMYKFATTFATADGVSTACMDILTVDSSLAQTSNGQSSDEVKTRIAVTPSNSLYMVFTSGSTGIPKGVVINHVCFSTALVSQREKLGLTPRSRVLDFSSYAFDMAWHNLLHSLYAGSSFCIPSDADRLNDLSGCVLRFNATFANLTPKVADLLSTSALQALDALEVGGELATPGQAQRWRQHTRVRWFYGPAETSAITTISDDDVLPTTLGRGIGLCTWITDPNNPNRLCPRYAIGELLLEGALVSKSGYFNDPEKTAAAFVNDPVWLLQGGRHGRLYRTGDLVKYDSTGNLIFVGRRDGQTKIRGQRVELGDIEHHVTTVLRTIHGFANVHLAADVVSPSDMADPILVAFVTCPESSSIAETTSRLREEIGDIARRLAHEVPSHMVPAGYIVLPKIPLSAAGKTNRRQLQDLGAKLASNQIIGLHSQNDKRERGLTTKIEEVLIDHWARALRKDAVDIGVDDSFFRLGGDSISAMRLVAFGREAGLHFTVSDVFQKLTIANLATSLRRQSSPRSSVIDLTRYNDDTNVPFELSPIQRFYTSLNPVAPARFLQSMVLEWKKPSMTLDQLDRALYVLVDRHAMLRARFSPQTEDVSSQTSGRWTQLVSDDIKSSYRLNYHDLVSHGGVIDEKAAILAGQRAIDSSGPLLVATLLDTSDSQRICLAIHHLVVDYVSWQVIVEDLEALLTSSDHHLARANSASFQQWCKLQADYANIHLKGAVTLPFELRPSELDYWGSTATRECRWDHAALLTFTLDTSATAALLGPLCNDSMDTRPVELLVAALIHSFGAVFADRSQPLTIYNEGHGRDPLDGQIDLSRMVGWLTTLSPVQIDGAVKSSITETIARVKDCMRSLPHHGWAHFASRTLSNSDETGSAEQLVNEVIFNNSVGVFPQSGPTTTGLCPLERKSANPWESFSSERRFALFDFVASMQGDCLEMMCVYDTHIRYQDKISEWITAYERTLVELSTLLPNQLRQLTLIDDAVCFTRYEDLNVFQHDILPSLQLSVSDIEAVYPCSPVQQGILVTQASRPELYRVRYEMESRVSPGPFGTLKSQKVDVARLKDAWCQIVRRYSVFRTIFVDNMPGSGFAQIVLHPKCHIPFKEGTEQPQTYHLEHKATIEVGSGDCVTLVLTINHALIDAHSYNLVLRDLRLAYDGKLGGSPPLTEFKDYVTYAHAQSLDAARDFWSKRLAGLENCKFPALCNDASIRTIHEIKSSSVDHRGLLQFCRAYNVTIASVCQAAWALVLSAYTGSSQPCFGFASSGREHPVKHVDEIVGPLISTLPNVVDMQAPTTLLDLVRLVQSQHLKSIPHSLLPLVDIMHNLSLQTKPFNTGISITAVPNAPRVDSSIEITTRGHDPTEFDVVVQVVTAAASTSVTLMYASSLLQETAAASVIGAFTTALASITANPRSPVEDVELIGPDDLQHLYSLNHDRVVPLETCLHYLVQEQVDRQPEATAIRAWDGALTYDELDQLSTHFSHQLVDKGVGPEVIVPFCFKKSMWAVVAMLAILKSGAAFCPINPEEPIIRQQELLTQTRARVVVVSSDLATMSVFLPYQIVVVDASSAGSWPAATAQIPGLTTCSPNPASAAYLIFTSGSTGKPKGVVVEHRSISTSCMEHGPRMGWTSKPNVLQFSSHTFDASVQEVFTTLIFGGCCCIPSEDARLSELGAAMEELEVNLAVLTPSIASTLAPRVLARLETLILCGERVSSSAIADWDCIPNILVGFGPSEASIVCTTGKVLYEDLESKSVIGTPVGSNCWIVSPENHERLMPIGAIGEMIVEGPIVARGYLDDATMTEAVFITPPSWCKAEAGQKGHRQRLYMTGDLVRMGHDGRIEFIGRKDDQVKINGQRIELGEIESHVRSCFPSSVAIVVEPIVFPGRTTQVLVGFVQIDMHTANNTRKNGSCTLLFDGPEAHALQALTRDAEGPLNHRSREALRPKIWLAISHIPINASGKTDRRQLHLLTSAISADRTTKLFLGDGSNSRQITGPRTATERVMRDLWARCLALPSHSISIEDNFFRLGGDSLLSIRLASMARECGVVASVGQIFLHPVLSDLSAAIRTVDDKSQPDASNLRSPDPFSLLSSDMNVATAMSLAATACGTEVGNIENIYPCTALQAGMMALSIKHPGEYVVSYDLELNDDIDEQRWREAWYATIRAHAILRTRIAQLAELGLFQVVVSDMPPWLQHLEAQTETLSVGLGEPLLHLKMARKGGGKRQFSLVIHHALFDGWSLPLILETVTMHYLSVNNNFLQGVSQFDTFIRYLQESSDDENQSFWRSYFDGLECSHFPPRPPTGEFTSERLEIERYCEVSAQRETGVTYPTLVKAALAIVLGRHTASHDVVYGCTVSGRHAPVQGIDKCLGPTVGTVPIRFRFIDDDRTAIEFLADVQQESAEMIPHEQTGLVKIAMSSSESRLACDFNTLLILQPEDDGRLHMSSFGRWIPSQSNSASIRTYPLVLRVGIAQSGLKMSASFDPRSILRDQAARLLQQLSHAVVELATAGTGTKLGDISTTTPEDIAQIWDWNADVPASEDLCVHDLVAEQARLRPSADAVCSWDGTVTYAEMEKLSDQLAHRIVNLAHIRGAVVPLFFDKSKWLPIAALAVMKAGGASVALDMEQPLARFQAIVEQVAPPIVLCSEARESTARAVSPHHVLVADDHLPAEVAEHRQELQVVEPTSLLYVVFTSGSTGVPKGATITHSNFTSAAKHQHGILGFDAKCRVFDFVSYAFDVAWSNMLHTLLAGGCLCIPSAADRRDDVAGAMERLDVNFAHLTPSLARILRPSKVPSLRRLCMIGEPLTASDVMRWRGTQVSVVNTYGPAETTVTSTIQHVDLDHPEDPAIGVGVGLNAWIVEPTYSRNLVPIGSIGELLLEGPLIGAGYLNDPEKTAASFVRDPSWLASGGGRRAGRSGRLYRTGDLVKYGPGSEGKLLFVGRIDGQVKIRGQRVELGEIEHHVAAALRSEIPSGDLHVAAELVTPRDHRGKPVLVAFFALPQSHVKSEKPILVAAETSHAINERLGQSVPAYMLPLYVQINSIPLAPTGKKDRRRLREIGSSFTIDELAGKAKQAAEVQRPSTETEHALRHAWSQILKYPEEEMGTDISFFQLGGDSISAMQVVAACRAQGLHRFRIEDIFKQKTIANLADQLEKRQRAEQPVDGDNVPHSKVANTSHSVPRNFSLAFKDEVDIAAFQDVTLPRLGLELSEVESVYPCSAVQEAMLTQQITAPHLYYLRLEFNATAPTDRPPVDPVRLRRAWETLVKRHPILRTVFVENLPGHGYAQIVLKKSKLKTQRRLNGSSLSSPTCEKRCEPLHGVEVFREAKEEVPAVRFVLTINHALIDAYSVNLLMTELASVYSAVPLDQNVVPYEDYIRYVFNQDKSSARAFWRKQLAGVEPCIFPTDTQAGEADINAVTIEIPAVGRTQVKEFCGRIGATISSVLQLGWALALRSYASSNHPCFGFVASGRDLPIEGIECIAGPTISTLPFAIMLDDSPLVLDLVQRAQESMTDAREHQSLSLLEIQQLLPLGSSKLFNTVMSVNIQSQEDSSPDDDLDIVFSTCGGLDVSEFDIVVQMVIGPEEIQGHLICTSCVPEMVLTSLAAAFSTAIASISLASEATSVDDVNVTSPRDLDLIRKWNARTPQPATSRHCVHTLISQLAQQHPSVPALNAWDGDMTYSELDEITTVLAHHLVSVGVRMADRIPVLFEKSKWAVVAMLAAAKAGAAFVTIDPTWPARRCEEIIAQIGADIVLTSFQCTNIVPASYRSVVVDAAHIPRSSPSTLLPVASERDLAYIIFTSGSTGQPKGVMIDNLAMTTSCLALGPALGFSSTTRALQFSSYVFDACIMEIFTTLLYSGCVCIPSDDEKANDLEEFISRQRTNWTFLTPSRARLLDPQRMHRQLETLVLGGEPVTDTDRRFWSNQVPRLLLGYGPTETSIVCLVAHHPPQSSQQTAQLCSGTIGTSVSSSRSWIVDASNPARLAPIGAIGELLIEGPVLASGYMNDKLKTEASFVHTLDWLLGQGTRLYRTGDLAKYHPEGTVSYMGRKDGQTKINGQRIEVGEIENQLLKASNQLTAAAVELVHVSRRNTTMLTAFIQFSGTNIDVVAVDHAQTFDVVARLDEQLRSILSTNMVPKLYVPMTRLPYTVAMKVDRRHLHRLASNFSDQQITTLLAGLRAEDKHARRPETPTECTISELWSQILGTDLDHIHVGSNFLRLGGDSLSALRLSAGARKRSIHLTVSDILLNPVLLDMAHVASTKQRERAVYGVLPFALLPQALDAASARVLAAASCKVLTDRVEDVYPCSPLQEGMLALSSSSAGDYVACYVLELAAELDLAKWKAAWEATKRSISILRTTITQLGSHGLFQTVNNESTIDWCDLTQVQMSEYIHRKKSHPPGPGEQQLSFAIARESESNNKGRDSKRHFIWTIHHALFDGWSLSLILREVAHHYRDMPSSSPRTLAFKQFIAYREEIMKSNHWQEFWRSQFKEFSSPHFPCPLPLARLKMHTSEPSGKAERFCALDMSIYRSSNTMASIIQAAWALVVSRHTASSDVVFGCTVYGRSAGLPGIEEVVGPTIATCPVRVRLQEDEPVSAFLARVQSQTTAMIPFEQAGLRRIKVLGPEAEHACRFQTLLIVQPREQTSLAESTSSFGTWHYEGQAQIGTYPFYLQCELAKDGVQLHVTFDQRVISSAETDILLEGLSSVLADLVPDSPLLVGDVGGRLPAQQGSLNSLEAVKQKIRRCSLQGRHFEARTAEQMAAIGLNYLLAELVDELRVVIDVVEFEDSPGVPVLVAFVTTPSLSEDELRYHLARVLQDLLEYLKAHLPSYMVPSRWVELRNLPLAMSGDIDYQHLRNTAGARRIVGELSAPGSSSQSVELGEPANAIEATLRSLMAILLERPEQTISRDDSFFSLGGDFITSMQLAMACREAKLPIRVGDVFERKTFARLAEVCARQASKPNTEADFSLDASTSANSQSTQKASEPFSLAFKKPGSLRIFQESILPRLGCTMDDVTDIYPCSPLQKGILISQAHDPDSYHVHYEVDVSPKAETSQTIDFEELRRSWQTVVQRHTILRTVLVGDMPEVGFAQIVLRDCKPTISWSGIALERSAALSAAHRTTTTRPHHQVTLSEGQNGSVLFNLKISHALIDAHSVGLILHDLVNIYSGLPLPTPVPYRDYVAYIERRSDMSEAKEYWAAELSGVQPCLFPIISCPPSQRPAQLEAPPIGRIGLRHFCQASNVTASSVFYTAWALILEAYTGNSRPCFGWIASARDLPIHGSHDIVGPMVNTLPIAINTSLDQGSQPIGSASLIQLVQRAQMQITASMRHQSLPLTDIQHLLRLDSARLFNTCVSVRGQDMETDSMALPDIQCVLRSGNDASEFDIAAHVYVGTNEVRIMLAYAPSVAHVIESLAAAYSAAVTGILTQSHQTARDISLVGKPDLERIWQWNATKPELVRSRLHDLVAKTVSRKLAEPAVCAWDGEISYKELDDLSTSLAQQICKQLAVADVPERSDIFIPILMDKSMWAVVGMVAILKAGCAFVPMDPKHPASRHRQILEQTQAVVVVVSSRYATNLVSLSNCTAIIADDELRQECASNEALHNLYRSSLAYAIFTSGSTGNPKGVLMEHAAASTSCLAHGAALGFGMESLRVLQYSAHVFDGTIMEIFTTLIFGGCICIPSETEKLDPESLALFIHDKRVNWAFLTPSVARCLLLESLQKLDVLISGGEVVTELDRSTWSQLRRFISVFGPTECCVISFAADYTTGPQDKATLGRAIAPGWRGWIVGQDSTRLQPIGAVGELLIEGHALAREYLNDPVKTSAAFIGPPSWLPDHDARLYRTGDLVKYNGSGTISFVGRKDDQIKINGQRVEVGEIEHRLKELLPRSEAVVVEPVQLRGQPPAKLVAFIQASKATAETDAVLDDEAVAATAESSVDIEAHLSQVLPAYMVPRLYLPLTRIPVTISGKTDRRWLKDFGSRLSEQQISDLRGRKATQQPRTASERRLLELWAQILGQEPQNISVDDHFLRSGGDSIAAMRLVSLARSHSLHISVSHVFSHPTIALLAAESDRAASRKTTVIEAPYTPFKLLEPLRPQLTSTLLAQQLRLDQIHLEDAFPATDMQVEWLEGALRGTMPKFNYFCLDFKTGDVGLDELEARCRNVVAHFETMRAAFPYASSGEMLQVVLRDIDINIARHQVPAGDDDEHYIRKLCSQGFRQDLSLSSPLTKFLIVKRRRGSPYCHSLIVRLSHAQYDGVSINMLCQALRDRLPEQRPFSHYASFIKDAGATSHGYWSTLLAGSSMTHLPPHHQPYNSVVRIRHRISFPCLENSTPATIFNAAWAMTLAKVCGVSDVVFGRVVAGRNAELDNIHAVFGPCSNKVPLRVQLTRGMKIRDIIQTVQEQQALPGVADSVSLQDIVKHCTDWPTNTTFGSVIQYQNLGVDAMSSNRGDGQGCRLVELDVLPGPGLFVLCTPKEGNEHLIELETSRVGITYSTARKLIDVLSEVVRIIADEGRSLH